MAMIEENGLKISFSVVLKGTKFMFWVYVHFCMTTLI